jgi:hypothetical protein
MKDEYKKRNDKKNNIEHICQLGIKNLKIRVMNI